jgi:hypothetical protein
MTPEPRLTLEGGKGTQSTRKGALLFNKNNLKFNLIYLNYSKFDHVRVVISAVAPGSSRNGLARDSHTLKNPQIFSNILICYKNFAAHTVLKRCTPPYLKKHNMP